VKIKVITVINLFDSFVGVVAFIEARSNTENRFEGISKQMEMLGATVSHYSSNSVPATYDSCYTQFQQSFPMVAFRAH